MHVRNEHVSVGRLSNLSVGFLDTYNIRLGRLYQPGAPQLHWGYQQELDPICYLP